MALAVQAWAVRATSRRIVSRNTAPETKRYPPLIGGSASLWLNRGMNYVVAVSGGVDSVVLLDMLVDAGEGELVVAHFDHGIRDDSASDARFVEGLAKRYGLPFETRRETLGHSASEELARDRRYLFLNEVASKYDGRIVTAHHADDVIETIALNLMRGTGWRGLAVFGNNAIHRPLVELRKQDIYAYALEHELEWVEDSTNLSDTYVRNRLRKRLAGLDDDSRVRLVQLWNGQRTLRHDIDELSNDYDTSSRYFMTMMDHDTAIELLRAQLARRGLSLTRPQRARLLHAIKTARPGTMIEAGEGVRVEFTKREFIVKHPL